MNKFGYRQWIIAAIMVSVCVVYIIRLFIYQVVDDTYKVMADNNSQHIEIQYPARGLIYDRNGKLLVDNQASYDLMIVPRQVREFDTLELLSTFELTKEELVERMQACKKYSSYKPSILVSQIPGDKYATFQEKLYRSPGFYIPTRTSRKYHVTHSGDVFGYTSEVTAEQIEKDP